jgi:hypothetical protein
MKLEQNVPDIDVGIAIARMIFIFSLSVSNG